MSREPTAFELCFPGIVARTDAGNGGAGNGRSRLSACFPGNVPTPSIRGLARGVGLASGLGVMSLFFHFRGEEEKPRQDIPSNDSKNKNAFPSGGTNAL